MDQELPKENEYDLNTEESVDAEKSSVVTSLVQTANPSLNTLSLLNCGQED